MSELNKYHGKVIEYKNLLKNIPSPSVFLDKDLTKKINSDISKDKPILFMPNGLWDDKPMQDAEYEKSKYKIVIFGVLENGERRSLLINDITPYFEIKIPDKIENKLEFAENLYYELCMEGSADYNKYKHITNSGLNEPSYGFKIEPLRYEIVMGKPLHGYQEHQSHYVQIYFDKLAHRKYAIEYVRALKYETAHDDTSCYYRVASRDKLLQLANWWTLKNYNIDYDNRYMKDSVIQISINDISMYEGEVKKHLQKDNLMTMAFDIETYNSNEDGEIPQPECPNHNVFMISMTFQWYHADNQLINVCLVDVPCAPNPDFLTVVCGTEENLIRAFALVCNKLQPHFIMGFNSDYYDWNWIVKGALRYTGLLTEVISLLSFQKDYVKDDKQALYSYRKNQHKVSAELSLDGYNIQLNSFIPIDLMIIFRQLYPTSEKWSLNFFLSKNKLGGKEDMPYQEMFQIYRDTRKLYKSGRDISQELLDKMSLVGKYCVVDSIRCHDLLHIRNILPDKREVANLSYTSIHDAFYRANGMKVRNLVIAKGSLRGLKISNINNTIIENGKYPGAWVFPPIKGLVTSKLSIEERITKAKLGYEEYREWLDVSESELESYKDIISKSGSTLNEEEVSKIETPNHFKRFLTESTGRPITGLDYSSLYPSLMMAYNLSPEYMITNIKYAKIIDKLVDENGVKKHELYKVKFDYNGRVVRGWCVRHDNKLDTTSPDCKFGIFPSILKELFDSRTQLKKGARGLLYWEHVKEEMEMLPKEEFAKPEVQEKWEDACFQFNMINSKQAALKVYMNTFYGESGNKRSPLFMLQVAGGITTAGRYNIKKAYEYVTEQGCKVFYGDTDSIYLAMAEKFFKEVDLQYYTGQISKIQYWEEMVNITFDTIKPLNKEVNDMLESDNGTKFLKMAYEEALFPCAFLAKKKYFGIPHISVPMFNQRDGEFKTFIKGLTMKTRGVSKLLVNYSSHILQSIINPINILTIMEVVQKSITDFYNKDWNDPELFDTFIMTDVFKPNKNNVKMHRFNTRMINERGIHITPGDRIKYVIVKKYPYTFDLRGRKTAISVGDKMEIAEKAQEEGISIDIDYYMIKKIVGQLSRFIMYHQDFQVHINNYDDPDEITKADKKSLDLARKYIENICKAYNVTYVDKGGIYKNIFKKSSAIVKSKLIKACGNNDASNKIINLLGFSVDPDKDLDLWLFDKIKSVIEKKPKNKNYGKVFVDNLLSKANLEANGRTRSAYIIDLQKSYYATKNNNILIQSELQYNERQQILEKRFRTSFNMIKNLYHINNNIIENVADYIKSNIKIEEITDESSKDINTYLESSGVNITNLDTRLEKIADENIDKSSKKIFDNISEMKFIYYNLLSNYEYIYQIRSIVEYLKVLRNKQINNIKAPSKKDLSKMIEKFVQNTVASL
jgi:DNA polymerase elongation subunit (family B)